MPANEAAIYEWMCEPSCVLLSTIESKQNKDESADDQDGDEGMCW